MVTKQTIIINRSGLHARPASDFILTSKKFESNITIRNLDKNGLPVNGKSIIRLLSEGISQGSRVEITAEGSDEVQAANALAELIESGFGEK